MDAVLGHVKRVALEMRQEAVSTLREVERPYQELCNRYEGQIAVCRQLLSQMSETSVDPIEARNGPIRFLLERVGVVKRRNPAEMGQQRSQDMKIRYMEAYRILLQIYNEFPAVCKKANERRAIILEARRGEVCFGTLLDTETARRLVERNAQTYQPPIFPDSLPDYSPERVESDEPSPQILDISGPVGSDVRDVRRVA